jgi:hypothetical protein
MKAEIHPDFSKNYQAVKSDAFRKYSDLIITKELEGRTPTAMTHRISTSGCA